MEKMKIRPFEITVRELIEGYENKEEEGVVAYGGKLDVRPPYQREFIYGEKDSQNVIKTIFEDYPLNVMYWADKEDGTFEIIDGQQRTLSICEYVAGNFHYKDKYFHNLLEPDKNKILDYKLQIYICKGNAKQKLDWFKIINIPTKQLTTQELRNASYAGPFISDAKRLFSKEKGPAQLKSKGILDYSPKRQLLLQEALKWMADKEGIKDIELYMAKHQHDLNADLLWLYFKTVIEWVNSTFNVSRWNKYLKNQDWAKWYELNKDKVLDKDKIDSEIQRLVKDSDVQKTSGIIPYIFTGDERYLDIRTFGDDIKEETYQKQNGLCYDCGKYFKIEEMEADHIKAWSKGGRTTRENCRMVCVHCNRTKSNK